MIQSSVVIKIPLLCLATAASHVALTSPNPPAKANEVERFTEIDDSVKESAPRLIAFLGWQAKAIIYATNILEACAILSTITDSKLFKYLPTSLATVLNNNQVRVTPTFLVGLGLVCTGACLRMTCYHYLGHLFTYELSVKKEHKLITTGPYSIVRHPSYTANILFIIGTVLCNSGSGSMYAEWVAHKMWGKVLGWIFRATAALGMLLFVKRTRTEDAVLKQHFGKEWDAWAKRTPYRLLRYIY